MAEVVVEAREEIVGVHRLHKLAAGDIGAVAANLQAPGIGRARRGACGGPGDERRQGSRADELLIYERRRKRVGLRRGGACRRADIAARRRRRHA